MTELAALRRDWEELAELDPLWAILTEPERRYGRWELGEFFATGEAEAAHVLARAEQLDRPAARGRALDFGSGVGRVTRALAARFEECLGVDISAAMVERARKLNADVPNCSFRLNTTSDLAFLDDSSFDFVYSGRVLQHMPSARVAESYMAELLRVARPDGLVVFQMPYHLTMRYRLQPKRRAYAALRRVGLPEHFLYSRLRLNPMQTIAMAPTRIREAVARSGGVLADVEHEDERSARYYLYPARDAAGVAAERWR